MAHHEQRASTRYDVEIEMEVARGEVPTHALTINLSIGGALIRVSAEPLLRVGEVVTVSFRLPDLDKPLSARAGVRWVNDVDTSIVGLQFMTGFRAKETWALGRFLERQAPA